MRAFGITLLVIIIAVAGGLFYLLNNLNSIVKAQIEQQGSAATGTKVTLDSISISLKDGSAELNNLRVANPQGYSTDTALSAGKIRVKIDVPSVMGKGAITISEVVVEAPNVNYEADLTNSNLATIQKHLSDYAKSLSRKQTETTGAKEPRKLIIEDLYVRNGAVSITHTALKGEKLSAELSEIHLRNIGKRSDGATYAEVARQVLGAVMSSASRTAIQKVIGKVGPLSGILTAPSTLKDGLSGILGP